MASSSMAPPPSPTKRASRFFGGGRHKRAESTSDSLGLMGPPQLPPLDFSFANGSGLGNAPPSPTKTDNGFGGPLPKPNAKARHMKTPSLMDLLTGKSKKDTKKDTGFTISTDDDCQDEQNLRNARPSTSPRVLQPAFVEQSQSMYEQLDASFLKLGMQNGSSTTVVDQENVRPSQRPSRILANTNKALPPIKTDIPDEIAREISLYTPKLYSASGQRNFAVTPELRAPQPRPATFYGQQLTGERKSSWGSIMSMGKRNSMGEADSGELGGFLSRVTSFGSGGNRRVHPAALDNSAPSTVTLNHEFNNLLSNYGLPHNIKNGASEMPAHVKATLLKSSKVMSRAPLPPPTSHGSPPNPPQLSPVTPAREKKKRPLSAFGAALFRGEHTRARSKTASTIGMPAKVPDDKGRPKTTRSDKAFRMPPPATPVTPSVKNNVGPLHANAPCDFIAYLSGRNYNDVDTAWLRRLKRMLRNERLAWVETFFEQQGLDRLFDLIKNIYELEYHDLQSGKVIKEVFLCLKAAYTAPMADARFDVIHVELFTIILSMMFDEERKKTPYEYETREAAISLMFTYLQQAPLGEQVTRARSLIKVLQNPRPANTQQGPVWVEAIRQPRPFTRWSSEVARLTYETGWVWYHPGNRITLREYDPEAPFSVAHFPTPRAFMAVDGGSVGSIEMNVANYAALHVEIMNAIIAYLPTRGERNSFRLDVAMSGMEKIMGQVLRCAGKGHHYEQLANIHSALTDWVTAARADGWEAWEHVRTGRFPAESQDKVKAMRKIEAMYGPQYELPDMGLEDTVAQKKRMSMKPEESVSVFQVTDAGVSLEWDF